MNIPVEGPPTLGIVNDDLTITFKRDLSFCHHGAIVVDAGMRTVECGKCKKPLDPIEALGNLARDSSSLVEERKALREDIVRWRAEHAEAKRQRDNAIAARKRVEYPEAKLMREIVKEHEDRGWQCKHLGDSARFCLFCRMRECLGRSEP